jgi:hypothetical protein
MKGNAIWVEFGAAGPACAGFGRRAAEGVRVNPAVAARLGSVPSLYGLPWLSQ